MITTYVHLGYDVNNQNKLGRLFLGLGRKNHENDNEKVGQRTGRPIKILKFAYVSANGELKHNQLKVGGSEL